MFYYPIIAFIIPYLLTFLGYPLGRITEYERKEIREYAEFFALFLIVTFYLAIAFFFKSTLVYVLLSALSILAFLAWRCRMYLLKELQLVLSYSIGVFFMTAAPAGAALLLLPVLAMTIEKSLSKFEFKQEALLFGFLLLFFFLLFGIG